MAILPQRPLRGSRISTFYPVKSLPSLASLDSAFQLQEYISLLIRLDVHDVEAITSLPGKRAGKEKEVNFEGDKSDDSEDEERGKNEPTVDEACWIYEQLRRLAQDLTHPLITMLQQECTRASCPEMKAGEWLYLCVAHGTDGNVEQCCAIDYILHTLDSATALLNTPRAFPSRIQIPQSSHRHFSSLARRLGRIFAHAYFHHREAFEQAEAESSLYARFLVLTSKFDLVPSEFLVIPTPSNIYPDSDHEDDDRRNIPVPRLLGAAVDQRRLAEGHWSRRSNVLPVETRTKSVSPPKLSNGRGSDSPRKLGRSRTDTMVLHDAYAVAEELAKASPKVPLLEAMEEPMSPMDVEDLPTTAKPAVECLEEIGESLPESPILHSPPPPIALSLLPEPPQEQGVPQKEPANSAAAVSPAIASEVERTTTESSPAPVQADMVETVPLTGVKTETSAIQSEDAIEDAPKETKEEPKETEHLADVVPENVQMENKEEMVETAHMPEFVAKEDPPGTLEVLLEAPAPTPAPQHTDELALAESKGSISTATQAEEKSTAVHNGALESTIVEIPDEMETLMEKVEAIEFIPETESPVGDKPEEKLILAEENISVPASAPAAEPGHVSS